MTRKLWLEVCFAFVMAGAALGSCSAPQNQIEAENCNPGTTGWEVDGSRRPYYSGICDGHQCECWSDHKLQNNHSRDKLSH